MGVLVKGANVAFRIENFNFRIALNVACNDFTFAGSVDINRLGTLRVNLENYPFEVEDDLRYVFLNAGDC